MNVWGSCKSRWRVESQNQGDSLSNWEFVPNTWTQATRDVVEYHERVDQVSLNNEKLICRKENINPQGVDQNPKLDLSIWWGQLGNATNAVNICITKMTVSQKLLRK